MAALYPHCLNRRMRRVWALRFLKLLERQRHGRIVARMAKNGATTTADEVLGKAALQAARLVSHQPRRCYQSASSGNSNDNKSLVRLTVRSLMS